MKKWIKGMSVAGLLLILGGVGATTAGAMMGGFEELGDEMFDWQGRVERRYEDWDDHWDDDYGRHGSVSGPRVEANAVEAPVSSDGEAAGPGQAGPNPGGDTQNGQIVSAPLEAGTQDFSGIHTIKVEIGSNHIDMQELEELESGSVRVIADGDGEYRYEFRQNGGELKLDIPEHVPDGAKMDQVTIYVPSADTFAEIEIENSQGSFSSTGLDANRLSIENGNDFVGGIVSIAGGSVQHLEIDNHNGVVESRALFSETASIENENGDVMLMAQGAKTDYSYQMEITNGEIRLGDEVTSAGRYEGKSGSQMGKWVELECTSGTIAITFEQ